jgi:phage FluMu gp28-like protein
MSDRRRPSWVPTDFAGGCKVFPDRESLMLAYQREWIDDGAVLKLMEKSRQIGISWGTAFDEVREKALVDARLDSWVSSRDDIQARLFLEDCKKFAELLKHGAQDLGEKVIDEKGHSAYVLQMANGTRIHSMSSNPDAQAGKRGNRILDEFALHPDPRKLWSIAFPGITWGGRMKVISTHRGSANYFNELVQEIRHKGNPKNISLHTVTLQTALEQGFLYKLQCKLPKGDPRFAMDEAEYFSFIRASCADEESFLQEFMCVPADDNSAFLSYDLIATCQLADADDLRIAMEDTISYAGQRGRIRRLQNLSLGVIAELPFDLYLGIDIGRDHDLTVLWLAALIAGVLVPVAIVEMEAVEFDRQEKEFYDMLALPRLRRACIDHTGIGRQMGERAQKRFGQYRVELITFTNAVKEELAYPVRSSFEDRTLRVPRDRKVVADLRAIKKETTASGNVRFTADRGKNGHSDRFWALALCKHAAKAPVSIGRFAPLGNNRGSRAIAARREREMVG